MDLCFDIVNQICNSLTDKSITRLLCTCKQLKEFSSKVYLKESYDQMVFFLPNFRYKLRKIEYSSKFYVNIKQFSEIQQIYFYHVWNSIDISYDGIKSIELINCKEVNNFPINLIKLYLNGTTTNGISSIIKKIPTNLKIFKLFHSGGRPTNLLKLDILPNSLKFLNLAQINIDHNFPSILRRLVLNNIKIFSDKEIKLPKSIEVLSLEEIKFMKNIKFKKLPKNVHTLCIDGNYFEIPMREHQNLKYIELVKPKIAIEINYLPDSIETINLTKCYGYYPEFEPPNLICPLPKKLKKIIIYDKIKINSQIKIFDNEIFTKLNISVQKLPNYYPLWNPLFTF